ncbi:MAG TPA: WbqC family protein, partial [Pseudolabrys sp.]|nr:WbqC family protein [Pseudolabrys sp.]
MKQSRKRTVGIVQSNYLPWRGYFDLIRSVDEFLLFDIVQYTRRDWRNRNRIKTPTGSAWITIPVEVKGKYHQAIDETYIADPAWAANHIRALELNYQRAAAFDDVAPWLFARLAELADEPLLSRVNEALLRSIAEKLNIVTPIRQCTDLLSREKMAEMEPSERLIALCQAANAERYLSGPAARNYLNEPLFRESGIEVVWMDYSGYPEYRQLWGPYDPNLSIIDLMLNTGKDAAKLVAP